MINRMSFFWSNQPMSWLRYMTLLSFRVLHPDWEVVLYESSSSTKNTWDTFEQTDAHAACQRDWRNDLHKVGVVRRAWQGDETKPASHQADLCKWFVLGECGGWVSDMDILWINSLPEQDADWDGIFCLHSHGEMTNGFGASIDGGHIIFRQIENQARRNATTQQGYQTAGVDAVRDTYGSDSLKCMEFMHPGVKLLTLPSEFVYPYSWRHIPQIYQFPSRISPATFGIHWYGGHPLSQTWNKLLTPENAAHHPYCIAQHASKIWKQCYE